MWKKLIKTLVKEVSLEITVKRREVHWKSQMLDQVGFYKLLAHRPLRMSRRA